MDKTREGGAMRAIGIALIVFAIGFNVPYTWLSIRFDYPAILRAPAGAILTRFSMEGAPLILAWAAFAAAALLLAPVAVAVARVTRRRGDLSQAVAALGIAAGVTQAIGLSRWVYAVPGLAGQWVASGGTDGAAATAFDALHQFAGVGVGEAIGQTLTAFWLIGVALAQRRHPRFGAGPAWLGIAGGAILILGLGEGLATVLHYDPGLFGFAAMAGFLVLTAWLIWTGVLCILRPAANA